jgi:hypothetical protein
MTSRGKETAMAQSMAPGGGGRFEALRSKLASEGKSSPGGLAAFIGRKKYGREGMARMASAGRRRGR